MPSIAPPARAARLGGLDGLRALAVSAVLLYHLFPGAAPGGFLGVDVFFVISGFLITTLLLRELEGGRGIALVAFWRRRARRLLPALGIALLICTALALPLGGDSLVGIGSQLAGAAAFVSNWVFIANGADYFARDTPELFRNTWSLAIEEQFYLVLPLALLLFARLRRPATRALVFATLGFTSAVLMAGLSAAGAEPTRVYFGSDTHTFGLLFGAALACLPALRDPARNVRPPNRAVQLGLALVAGSGAAVLIWLVCTLREGSPDSFQGGFQLATVASLTIVWAVTREGAVVGRALDAAPLRWLGERSYGVYLWHWPLLVLLTTAFGRTVDRVALGLVTLTLTIVVAALSYRFVEQPVRRLGLRRSLALLARPGSHTPHRRAVAVVLTVTVAVSLPASVAAVALAPTRSSAADAIARGQEALDGRGTPTDRAGEGSAGADPAPADAPLGPTGEDITALGDSVMLASLPELDSAFPGIAVDASVSRGLETGLELVRREAADGTLRRVVVLGLGTNGPIEAAQLDAAREAIGARWLVLVTAHGDRDWIPGVNAILARFAADHRGVVLADWDAAIAPHPDLLAGDGIHPEPAGGEVYAATIERALEALQRPGETVGLGVPRR